MNSDRRQRVRYQVSFPVSLATIDSTLDGQAINASREGVLLEAEGRLGLRVTIKGRDYRGWLVRASRMTVERWPTPSNSTTIWTYRTSEKRDDRRHG